MHPVKRFFENNRKHFSPGGRLAKLGFLFEVFEGIFFMPANVTRVKPFVRDFLDAKRYMYLVIIGVLPCYALGVYNAGLQSYLARGLDTTLNIMVFAQGLKIVVPIVLVTYIVGFFWEALFAGVRKIEMNEGLFVSCALFPLILPPTIPLWQVAVGISFGIVIGKEIFGGTGHNFLNPALAGRTFLYFAYPAQSSGDAVWTYLGKSTHMVDGFTAATPLKVVKDAAESGLPVVEQLADAGYTFKTLFLGLHPDCLGSSFMPLIILGGVSLLLIGIADYRIVLGGLIGTLLTALVFYLAARLGGIDNAYMAMNPVFHLLMGGLLFGLFFMATDPVSAPDLNGARWLYGFLIGFLTVTIRIFNPAYPECTALTILFMNCMAPLLDEVCLKLRLRKRIPNVG